jgi:hypothetical protein
MTDANGKGPTKLPASVGDRNAQYKEFQAATGKIAFGKDFHTAQLALMRDETLTFGHRVLAWVKYRAWGKFSLYCVRDDRAPAHQSDCETELQMDKSTVSNCLAFWEARRIVRKEGRLLYPVINPPAQGTSPKVSGSQNFSQFLEWWKVSSSSNFHELEVSRARVKELRKVQRSDYKKWLALQQDGGASLLTLTTTDLTTDGEAAAAEVPLIKEEAPPPPSTQPVASSSGTAAAVALAREPEPQPCPGQIVDEALNEYGIADPDASSQLIHGCRAHAPDATEDEIADFIRMNGPRAREKAKNPIGWLLKVVPAFFKRPNWRRQLEEWRRQRDKAPPGESDSPFVRSIEQHMRRRVRMGLDPL